MTIEFSCPAGHKLKAADDRAGRQARCPACNLLVTVPDGGANRGRSPQSAEQGRDRAPAGREPPAADDLLFKDTLVDLPISAEEPSAESEPVIAAERALIPTPPTSQQPVWHSPSDTPSGELWASPAERVAADRRWTIYWLGAALAHVSLLSMLPVLLTQNWQLADAPGWARLVLLLAGLQLAYTLWMVTLPDYGTVWVAMIVFAVVAAIYGMGMAIAWTTPVARTGEMPLGLAEVRRAAVLWCLLMVMAMGSVTFLCGRTSYLWRRQLELARRAGESAALSNSRVRSARRA